LLLSIYNVRTVPKLCVFVRFVTLRVRPHPLCSFDWLHCVCVPPCVFVRFVTLCVCPHPVCSCHLQKAPLKSKDRRVSANRMLVFLIVINDHIVVIFFRIELKHTGTQANINFSTK